MIKKTMYKKILMVDVSSVFHRSYHSLHKRMGEAVDINGTPCAGTYGFLTSFFRAAREFGPFSHYLFAIDVRGSTNSRKKANPLYKKNRESKPSSFYADKDNLTNLVLPMLGIIPLGLVDYEADDIIASSCNYTYNVENVKSIFPAATATIIMSGDGDLEMCTKYSPNIHFLKTQPSWHYQSNDEILAKWKVSPEDMSLIKAIIGDASDNIRGVYGYKLVKALKVYKDPIFLEKHKEIIENNLSVLSLKDNLESVPRSINITKDTLESTFTYLNAHSLLKRTDKIKTYF